MKPALAHALPAALVLVLQFTGVSPSRAASPCDRPECRQFDFWIGDWEVTDPAGKVQGTNRIEKILGGCVLQENWEGAGGGTGKSFNLWTAQDSLWHQTWVASAGYMLTLAGTFHDGKMVLEGDRAADQPAGTRNRITWTPRPDGMVEQHWETTADGGKSWTTVFLGIYRKKSR